MKPAKSRALLIILASIISCSLLTPVAFADEVQKQLVGTWKLTAWIVQVIGEGSREPYGPNPKGRLVITPEGHWIIVITGANRQPAKTIDEKAALLDSMLAYSGKYRIEGDKITTKVDMSSNEIYTGANQDQTRFFKVEGTDSRFEPPRFPALSCPAKKSWVRSTLNGSAKRRGGSS